MNSQHGDSRHGTKNSVQMSKDASSFGGDNSGGRRREGRYRFDDGNREEGRYRFDEGDREIFRPSVRLRRRDKGSQIHLNSSKHNAESTKFYGTRQGKFRRGAQFSFEEKAEEDSFFRDEMWSSGKFRLSDEKEQVGKRADIVRPKPTTTKKTGPRKTAQKIATESNCDAVKKPPVVPMSITEQVPIAGSEKVVEEERKRRQGEKSGKHAPNVLRKKIMVSGKHAYMHKHPNPLRIHSLCFQCLQI